MQKSREERAQSAAEQAADELAAARQQQQQQGQHDGILGGVQETARSAMDAVRGTLSSGGAAPSTAATTGTKGAASDRASWGVMDAARSAAERAREFAAEGARQALAGDAVARKGETDESAWQQGQDVRRRAAEKAQEEQRSAREHPSEAEKGRSATENIYGKARGAMGAFGEKMVMPTDVVEQKRAEAAGGDGNAAPKGSGRGEQAGGGA